MIIGVPVVTIVMGARLLLRSTSATDRLSMLEPRPENSPITRARTPGSLSTRTAMVCRSIVSLLAKRRASDEHHALFRDRLFRLVGGAEQHLVMGGARGDHREAVLRLVDDDVEDHRLGRIDHLGDRVIDLVRPLDPPADRAE